MLIQSHRHTDADLVMWSELEAADRLHGRSRSLATKVDRAMNVIREFLVASPAYCSVSWGKDSVVVADLVRRVAPRVVLGNLRVVPSRNPHCDDVRDAFIAIRPMKYREVVVDYSAVDRSIIGADYDRETDRLWRAGFRELEATCRADRHFSGVRGDESPGRLIRMCRWGESSPNACAPIGRWSLADVFGYLAANDLPVHPNYAMLGGGRWDRQHVRTAEIGDSHGRRMGRAEWEREYYGDVLARIESKP